MQHKRCDFVSADGPHIEDDLVALNACHHRRAPHAAVALKSIRTRHCQFHHPRRQCLVRRRPPPIGDSLSRTAIPPSAAQTRSARLFNSSGFVKIIRSAGNPCQSCLSNATKRRFQRLNNQLIHSKRPIHGIAPHPRHQLRIARNTPVCGPPSNLSQLNESKFTPAATLSLTSGSSTSRKSSNNHCPDLRKAEHPCVVNSLQRRSRRKASHLEVRRMHPHNQLVFSLTAFA